MPIRSLFSATRAELGYGVPHGKRLGLTATVLAELNGAVFDNVADAEHLAEAVLAAGGSDASEALLALLERMPDWPKPDH